jgi:hypothetical protein
VAGGRRDRHAGKSSEKANAATAAMRAARPWRDTAIDNTRRLKLNLGAEIREKRENWEIREENNREIRGDRGGDREIGEVREKNDREIGEVGEKNQQGDRGGRGEELYFLRSSLTSLISLLSPSLISLVSLSSPP